MVAPIEIARRCTASYFPEANVLVSINNTAEGRARNRRTDILFIPAPPAS